MVATDVPPPLDEADALAGIDDEALPAVPTLLQEPVELLDAALAPAGGRIRTVTPRQTTWRPGRSLTVRYDARVIWPSGDVTDEMLVARTGEIHPESLVLEADAVRVAVWRVPHDPWLPGLAAVTDPARVGPLLDALDIHPGHVEVRIVSYRPGRRAVVRLRRAGVSVFAKVTRPGKAKDLHDGHLALSEAVPVPRSLGVDPDLGIVVLQGLGGTLLRHRLAVPGASLPGPEGILSVLDRLPAPSDGRRVAGWRSQEWASLLGRVRPDRATDLQALAGELTAVEAARTDPLVPVHGDLHEAQLMVQRGRITGLLDIDTHGLGHRVDDLATLIGHLAVLATTTTRRATIERYAARLLDGFDRVVDPVLLRYAVAEVILGLATGPFRVLEPHWPASTDTRIELAGQWAASARRIAARREAEAADRHETTLTSVSGRPHLPDAE